MFYMKELAGLALMLSVGFGLAVTGMPDIGLDSNSQVELLQEEDEDLPVQGQVTAVKNGEVVAQDSNVMLDGEAIITELLTSTQQFQYETIAVGDGSVPTSGDSELDGRITTDGLDPTTGTADLGPNNEEYEVEVTFTATGSQDVSTTALEINNDYSTETNYNTFAATDFGRTIPMEDGDELTITWEIDPQNP